MRSCLGGGAEWNAAIMRCGYSNFFPTDFIGRNPGEPYLGARIEGVDPLGGVTRHVEITASVVEEALGEERVALPGLPLICCLPRPEDLPTEDFHEEFNRRLLARLEIASLARDSVFYYLGRSAAADAFHTARECLEAGHPSVLVVAADSLLNARRIAGYGYGSDLPRLLDEGMPDGLIPGEAAVALRLSEPNPERIQTCITGLGFGEEEATLESDLPLLGEGLTQAARDAAQGAGIRVSDTDFCLSSANGESYFFEETALVASRILEQKCESWPLWHPADHIGEVGAAVGLAMVVMAHYALVKGYAPGPRALCQLSGDDSRRSAFILERRTTAP
jgi:3-oxoacyl-[acyl-carrier-protein] synthase-1